MDENRLVKLQSALMYLTEREVTAASTFTCFLDIPNGSFLDDSGNLYDPHTLYKRDENNMFDRGTHIKRQATAVDRYYFALVNAVKAEITELVEHQERGELQRLKAKYEGL